MIPVNQPPNDRRGIFHKKLLGIAAGFIPGVGTARDIVSGIFGGSKAPQEKRMRVMAVASSFAKPVTANRPESARSDCSISLRTLCMPSAASWIAFNWTSILPNMKHGIGHCGKTQAFVHNVGWPLSCTCARATSSRLLAFFL